MSKKKWFIIFLLIMIVITLNDLGYLHYLVEQDKLITSTNHDKVVEVKAEEITTTTEEQITEQTTQTIQPTPTNASKEQPTTEITTELTTEVITETTEAEEIPNIFNVDEDDENFTININDNYYTFPKQVNYSDIAFPDLGYKYAEIHIPRVQINAEVYKGSTQDNVDTYDTVISGIASYCGSNKPIIICGHKTRSFAELKHIEVDDKIFIQTNYGGYLYNVIQSQKGTVNSEKTNIEDEDGNELLNFDGETEELFLYTCYDDADTGLERWVIKAEKIIGTQIIH